MSRAKRCALILCTAGLGCGAQTMSSLPPPVPLPGTAGNAHGSYEFHVLTRTTLDDKIISLRLAPHIATNVRLPEAVNSVVVGSPECFAVEHSEGESQLVTIRPKKEETCESNLQITTVSGRHALLDLNSFGSAPGSAATVDVLLRYVTLTPGSFLEERSAPSLFVAETRPLEGVEKVQDACTRNW